MSPNKPLYGVCTKLSDIENQIVRTKHEILPGQFIKMILINPDEKCCVIKLYDRDKNNFGTELYKGDKDIIRILDNPVWSFVKELGKGNIITITSEIPEGKIHVNFRIKCIGDVPALGAGHFFMLDLDLADNSNLIEDQQFYLRMKYYNSEVSAYCIRGDRLIEALILNPETRIQPRESFVIENPQLLTKSLASTTSSANNLNSDLIKHEDSTQNFKPFELPSVSTNLNTENDSDGMVNYIQSNKLDGNLKVHDFYARNNNPENISNIMCHDTIHQSNPNSPLIKEFRTSLNVTPLNNVPAAILHKIGQNTLRNSSAQNDYKHFELPAARQNIQTPKFETCESQSDSSSSSDDCDQDDDDTQRTLESINNRGFETGTNNAPAVMKFEEELFIYDNEDSNEVLFHCKQENCAGMWFVDKTELRNIYPCPVCEVYNCFKCQVIHDNMTCEEYNQYAK